MRAMILAAGHGKRMRPLTDTIPKPLLEVAGIPLIVRQINSLVKAGINELVINTGRLGEQIQQRLGNGTAYGATIQYSIEGEQPLETAGGIIQALPLLGSDSFIVTNADIVTDFDYSRLRPGADTDATLVMVSNPTHHPEGDYGLEHGRIMTKAATRYTFSGIGLYHNRFFRDLELGSHPLAPLIRTAADKNRVHGILYNGYWNDVGTPERLKNANQFLPHNESK